MQSVYGDRYMQEVADYCQRESKSTNGKYQRDAIRGKIKEFGIDVVIPKTHFDISILNHLILYAFRPAFDDLFVGENKKTYRAMIRRITLARDDISHNLSIETDQIKIIQILTNAIIASEAFLEFLISSDECKRAYSTDSFVEMQKDIEEFKRKLLSKGGECKREDIKNHLGLIHNSCMDPPPQNKKEDICPNATDISSFFTAHELSEKNATKFSCTLSSLRGDLLKNQEVDIGYSDVDFLEKFFSKSHFASFYVDTKATMNGQLKPRYKRESWKRFMRDDGLTMEVLTDKVIKVFDGCDRFLLRKILKNYISKIQPPDNFVCKRFMLICSEKGLFCGIAFVLMVCVVSPQYINNQSELW